jgi:hypothetical protein
VIDHHRQILGLSFGDQVDQHLRKNKRGFGRLARRAFEITKGREIRAENLGVAVDDVKRFGHPGVSF